jgi:hypothetical protein
MRLSRRQFLSRGSLLAAGGFALSPTLVWLSEQMQKLQPKPRLFLSHDPWSEPQLARLVHVDVLSNTPGAQRAALTFRSPSGDELRRIFEGPPPWLRPPREGETYSVYRKVLP